MVSRECVASRIRCRDSFLAKPDTRQFVNPDTFPAPLYAETVLAPNFEDAQRFFLDALIEIHYAHTRMLAHQEILPGAEERQLRQALDELNRQEIATAPFDGKYEDLFFYVEHLLEQKCGPLAGKMHTARSRNDIAITLYRMTLRRLVLDFTGTVAELRKAVLDLASRHVHTVMPAHTHTQPAQPTTLAHYLVAVAEFLARDAARLESAYSRVNCSPLGACAITTTGFSINRDLTAELLGFEGLAENSYGAIASIDYVTESMAAVAVAMVNTGKFVQDLLLWSTREFGFLRLPDAFVQSSSIMPQKRNPVALEHSRILASRALGQAQAVLTCAHNTPFGDINDSEDDLQPLVFAVFGDASRSLKLLAGLIAAVEVDREELRRRAASDFITVTELADTLVRRTGISFRQAHTLVAHAVKAAGRDDSPAAVASALLSQNPLLTLDRVEIERALDPVNFVEIRKIIGGPAPEVVEQALARAGVEQRRLEQWAASRREKLEQAQRRNTGA